MKYIDSALQRLLQSAAKVSDAEPTSVPFGFDTRVVALWRGGHGNGGNGIARLLRQVAAAAAIVIVVSSAASYHEYLEARDAIEAGSNDYSIADSAIDTEFYQ